MGKLNPQQRQRESQALQLRIEGLRYHQIAEQLGYCNEGGAWKAVQRALDRTVQEPADELRQLECQRLDALLAAMLPKALAGSGWAVDRCLSIMDRRARLLGLDAPRRQELYVVTEDVIDRELRLLEARLAENDPETAENDVEQEAG